MSLFSIASGVFDLIPSKLKVGISIALIIGVVTLGFLYNRSLNKLAEVKAELASTKAEMEKIVTATNKYKETTEKLLNSYSDDLTKWQNKVEETRKDCDTRIKLFTEAENVDISEFETEENVSETKEENKNTDKVENKTENKDENKTQKKKSSTVLSTKSSKAYADEINKRLRNVQNYRSSSRTN